MPAVLDTTFLVDVARGHPGAKDLLERLIRDGEQLLVPTVALAEYLAGSPDPDGDISRLRASAELVPFSVEDARLAGALARGTSRSGRFPGWGDTMIGAVAQRHGASVVTANARHFTGLVTIGYG